MNELDFYNKQFEKYQKYDRDRSGGKSFSLDNPEDYFENMVRSHSSPENTLVDLGCGDGFFTSKLAGLNCNVIGIEPSSLINAANDLLQKSKLSNLIFLKEDAYSLPLEKESVDLVISRRGPDPEKEILRVLKPDGIFIFITIGERDAFSLKSIVGRGQHFGGNIQVSNELKEKFNGAGFIDVHYKNFYYDDVFDSSSNLKEFLHQVPIFDNFAEADYKSIDEYCGHFLKSKVLLNRHRIVLFAKKAT